MVTMTVYVQVFETQPALADWGEAPIESYELMAGHRSRQATVAADHELKEKKSNHHSSSRKAEESCVMLSHTFSGVGSLERADFFLRPNIVNSDIPRQSPM